MKLSKRNIKMGNIWSVSMTPGAACKGCEKVCLKDCYAMKAYKQYPATRSAWDHNLSQAINDPSAYFAEIRTALKKYKGKFFRWHVAGDIISHTYFRCMCEVAEQFPNITFLVFTKQYEIVNEVKADCNKVLKAFPRNLSVVFSAWPGLEMNNPYNFPIAYMNDGTETRLTGDEIACPGHCETCGLCYSLGTIGKNVVFEKH